MTVCICIEDQSGESLEMTGDEVHDRDRPQESSDMIGRWTEEYSWWKSGLRER